MISPRKAVVGRRPALLIALSLAACVTVHLVSDYDATTDQEISAFQKFVDDSLTAWQGLGAPQCLYPSHVDFYTAAFSSLQSLTIRNQARGATNKLTTEQISLLTSDIVLLQKLHKGDGSTPAKCMNTEGLAGDKDLIDTSIRSILTLELAKKRGSDST